MRDIASERLCDTDLIAYGEWQYLYNGKPVVKAAVRVQHHGKVVLPLSAHLASNTRRDRLTPDLKIVKTEKIIYSKMLMLPI